MRDLEELIPQMETIMREKAELEQQLASVGRAHAALEEQEALRRELQETLRRTTSTHMQLQADAEAIQAENARLTEALAQQKQVGDELFGKVANYQCDGIPGHLKLATLSSYSMAGYFPGANLCYLLEVHFCF